jgi:LytS/YehU family sensor histidine kinase
LHLAASLALICVQTFVETLAGWWPHAAVWPFQAALRHYFTQHIQIGLLTYWLILAAVHFYRMHDQARQREARLAEAQLQVLRTQLQPHFLFNTLQAATMLIYDDPQGAEEILLSLSELLRVSLEALREQEVSLDREMEFLKHYAAIQQRRFGDRLQFLFDVPRSVCDCAVPSLVLQPLVENAIRHGIGKYKGEDVVSIRAFRAGDRLCLEVSNLRGRLDDAHERLFSRGVGLSNTLARLEQLYGPRQSLQLNNLEPVGVLVALRIPARILPLDRAGVTALGAPA